MPTTPRLFTCGSCFVGMGCTPSRSDPYGGGTDTADAPSSAKAHEARVRGDGGVGKALKLPCPFTDPLFDVIALGPAAPSQFAVACDDGRIGVYDHARAAAPTTWPAHAKSVNRLAYGAGAGLLASGGRDALVKLWRIGNPQPLAEFAGHTLTVSGVDISPDCRQVASGARDTSVRVWDVEGGRESARNSVQLNVVTDVKWLPPPMDTVVAQCSEDLNVKLWDVRTPGVCKLARKLDGYIYFPLCVDVSEDATYLLTSSKGFNHQGGEARLWDLRTMSEVCQYIGHEFDTVACAFLPLVGDTPRIITASKDATIRVWDRTSAACVIRHHDAYAGSFTSLCVLPYGGEGNVRVAATTITCAVFVYEIDFAAGRLVCIAHTDPVAPS